MAVHGGLAHGGDYVTPALFFKDREIATVAYDLRGHKQKKVCIDSFEQLFNDTRSFLNWVKNLYPDLPAFFLAHSIGALIATHIGLRSANDLNGVKGFILSSPYYKNAIKTHPFVIPMMEIFSRILPSLPIPSSIGTDKLTHDQAIFHRHLKDEEDGLRAEAASMRFGSEIFSAQNWVELHISNWNHPLFAVLAGDDQVADTPFSQSLLKQIPPEFVTCYLKEGNFHENLNELDRETTFEQIYQWIKSKIELKPDF